jgi:protein-disulfide isomerase
MRRIGERMWSLLVLLAGCASARVPAVVDAERVRTPRGEIAVVEFVDFECPFCRAMNDDLAPLVAARGSHVRVVRKQVPLTRHHPHAMDAARVSICADAMGRGDAVADALFRAPPDALTPDGVVDLAARVGRLDAAAVRTCMADPRTDAQINADTESFFVDAGGDGVPTVWIDDQVFVGQQEKDTLKRALDRAIARVSGD